MDHFPSGAPNGDRVTEPFLKFYNRGRLHASLEPGIPDPPIERAPLVPIGHRLPETRQVLATPILGGLHHEYRFAQAA